MSISLKQALVFVPQTSHWLKKIAIGGFLLYLPLFAFIFPGIRRMIFDPFNAIAFSFYVLISIIAYCIVTGYFFKTVHNRIIHDKEGLPDWNNIYYYLTIGAKANIGGFIFSLPFVLITLLIITFMPLLIGKAIVPFAIAAIILNIIYAVFVVMAALNFAIDFKMKSFFNLKKAFNRIKDNLTNYIHVVLYCVAVWFSGLLISMILVSAQIFSLILPFFTFYTLLIYTDLFAQFEAQNKEGIINEAEYVV